MSVDPSYFECDSPDCLVEIPGQAPGDQAPGQFPQQPPPYYPGFDLPDEPQYPSQPPPGPRAFPAPRIPPRPLPPAPQPSAPPAPPTLATVVVRPGDVPFSPIGAVGPVFLFGGPGKTLAEAQLAQLQALLNEPLLQGTDVAYAAPGEPPPQALGPPKPGPVELPSAPPAPPESGLVDVSATETAPGQLSLFEEAAVAPKPSLLSLLGGVLGKAFGAAGLLMQTTEAGFAPGVEEALVAARLTNPFPAQNLTPDELSNLTGLPPADLVAIPPVPETVVVSAPRVAPVVFADPLIGYDPVTLGIGPVPDVGPVATPTRSPKPVQGLRPLTGSPTSPRPKPAPLLGELGGPGPSRFPGEGLGPTVGPQTQPKVQPDPLNSSSTCTQPKEPKKKKKQQKKQPRTVCYRGTYTELTHGLIKHRKERIPCR
ncbi:MAG TPA: hypothetical protein VF748_15210 [Candidatus Acidoferrum sp.]